MFPKVGLLEEPEGRGKEKRMVEGEQY
jgi:hypothetical protein